MVALAVGLERLDHGESQPGLPVAESKPGIQTGVNCRATVVRISGQTRSRFLGGHAENPF
jgi:hypothetical protein